MSRRARLALLVLATLCAYGAPAVAKAGDAPPAGVERAAATSP